MTSRRRALAGASNETLRLALFVTTGLTTIVRVGVMASGAVPFAARTVNVNVPAAVGVPARTPAAVSVRPPGRAPVFELNVIGDVPVAVNVYGPYAVPTAPGDGGVELTNTGATGAALTTIVRTGVTAFGSVPLAAVTEKLNVPVAVGVPDRTPAGLKASPGGRPLEAAKVIGDVPVAVNESPA